MYDPIVDMMGFGRGGFNGGMFGFAMLAMLWTLPWKGVALWKAARAGSKPWFVALLLINTLGILEILYIFVFSKPAKPVEAKK